MIPISDDNPCQTTPYITVFLMVFMAAIFSYEFWLDARGQIDPFIRYFGLVPEHAFQTIHSFFTYIFIHAGWLHILPNLLFLWIFADNIEDALGHIRFLVFFLCIGALSALMHIWLLDFQGTMPLIGASGAVSGILGAYFALYRNIRIKVFFPTIIFMPPLVLFGAPFFWRFYMPAFLFLALWFGNDLYHALTCHTMDGSIAFWTHISGFMIGAALGLVLNQHKTDTSKADSNNDFRTVIRHSLED